MTSILFRIVVIFVGVRWWRMKDESVRIYTGDCNSISLELYFKLNDRYDDIYYIFSILYTLSGILNID